MKKIYALPLLLLIAVTASISGCISDTPSTDGQNKIQVQVDYPGYWEGTYGDENGGQSVSGTGPQTFDVPDNPSIVSALFQKMDGGSENLTVRILKNGEVLAERSTNADYGIADVCVTTF